MSRRRRAVSRPVPKDAKFNSSLVTRLVNTVMSCGKKSTAERIVYGAFDELIAKNPATNPLDVLQRAVDNAKPRLEVKQLRLVWRHPIVGQYINAAAGNSGGVPHYIPRGYNSTTDFELGNFGLDTTQSVVWAVVNHNSEFAVAEVPVSETILSITRPTSDTIRLTCLGVPDALNRIESSPDLNPNHFTTLASVLADAAGAYHYEEPISATNRFYRLAYP